MGSIYLAILMLLGAIICAESSVFGSPVFSLDPLRSGKKLPSLFAQNAQGPILLPPNPVLKKPILTTDEDLDRDIEKKKEVRKKREASVSQELPTLKDRLIAEAQKPRPYLFYCEWSLVAPHMLTTGPRKDYRADYIANHISWIWYGHGDPFATHFLYGLRMAAFSGSGIYNQVPGRFGFLYLGPAVGWGGIHRTLPEIAPDAKTAAEKAKAKDSVVLMQGGWTLLAGLSVQSRMGFTDATTPTPNEDLNTRSFAVDSAGGWIEASVFYLLYGAIGVHINAGAQQGAGKLFYWVGLGTSVWY